MARIRAMVGALVPGVIITGDTSIEGLRDARADREPAAGQAAN